MAGVLLSAASQPSGVPKIARPGPESGGAEPVLTEAWSCWKGRGKKASQVFLRGSVLLLVVVGDIFNFCFKLGGHGVEHL